jgi:hypothetical protein
MAFLWAVRLGFMLWIMHLFWTRASGCFHKNDGFILLTIGEIFFQIKNLIYFMPPRISRVLCVAEKPSVSKAVSRMLSHDNVQTTNTKNKYIKNYAFVAKWNGQAQDVNVTMTAVSGHLMDSDFDQEHRKWSSCPPEDLFTGIP